MQVPEVTIDRVNITASLKAAETALSAAKRADVPLSRVAALKRHRDRLKRVLSLLETL